MSVKYIFALVTSHMWVGETIHPALMKSVIGGGVLAHAYYPTPDNVYSFSGDAHFDGDEDWNDGPHKGRIFVPRMAIINLVCCINPYWYAN
ncbi:unnamed protein product [Protopolystoma xenopodis]|uniref:Peptidase M10 metallopeptidase domain-containing protein n=1 Tax=Protopolystoma xenopodis TaxID=117903 RepID=A0A448WJ00_9PLAT|nr:unnamed protein product [Protopolystoma xenopodis]